MEGNRRVSNAFEGNCFFQEIAGDAWQPPNRVFELAQQLLENPDTPEKTKAFV